MSFQPSPVAFLVGEFAISYGVVQLLPAVSGKVLVRPPGLAQNPRGPCDSLNLRSRQVPSLSRPLKGTWRSHEENVGQGSGVGPSAHYGSSKYPGPASWELGTTHAHIAYR